MDMTILHSNVRGMTPKKWEHVRAAVKNHHLPTVLGEEAFTFTMARDIFRMLVIKQDGTNLGIWCKAEDSSDPVVVHETCQACILIANIAGEQI